ncbi:MAG: T9SS type A sorting domain-containing protein [Bacteroidetes bacterium]|nr:T9SS type A sorting domain-containing protein [Bacteroidota bacterium]
MRVFNFLLILCIFNPLFAQNNLKDKYDVKQYILDLNVSNNSTIISGNVIINSTVIAPILDTFVVDLIDTVVPSQTFMVVDSVLINGVSKSFIHHNDLVMIPLLTGILQNQPFKAQVFYHGNGNAISQTDYNGICKYTYTGKIHTCTFSEPTWSKVWWPCKQDLKDKADSITFYITTDSTNKSGSNGKLISTMNLLNGKVKYKWETNHPTAFYLVSFTVGPLSEFKTYAVLPGGTDSVLIQNLLFPSSNLYQSHLKAINKTKQLIYLFSDIIGTYPFKNEKYGYCVVGTPLGAMEHQTMCTIGYQCMDTTSTLYAGSYYYWYVAHELAHQWFGDYVTFSDWNDIWLAEGFSSYMEYIALQRLESQTKADYWIKNAQTETMSQLGGSVYAGFDYRLMYKKSSAIIHTLRYEINNDSLFFAVLKNYLSTYAYSVATTNDFKQVAESTTGMSFTDFFNQWYYGEGYPIFNLNWSQENDTLTIVSNQTTSSSITPLYKTHFDLKLYSISGNTMIREYQGSNQEVYKIPISGIVDSIAIDPDNWLLKGYNIVSNVVHCESQIYIKCYPNPFDKTLCVQYSLEKPQLINFEIMNQQGQIIEEIRKAANRGINNQIIGSSLENGIYFIKLFSEDFIKILKVVKE